MSLLYYSRLGAVLNLLPLLAKSALPATVVSVYAAWMEGELYADDLSLRDQKWYSYAQARSHMCRLHALALEAPAA